MLGADRTNLTSNKARYILTIREYNEGRKWTIHFAPLFFCNDGTESSGRNDYVEISEVAT